MPPLSFRSAVLVLLLALVATACSDSSDSVFDRTTTPPGTSPAGTDAGSPPTSSAPGSPAPPEDVDEGDPGPGTTTTSPPASPTTTTTTPPLGGGSFTCTEVIGFSQTGQWFEFVDIPGWQARIQSGASVEKWINPDFNGWNAGVRGRVCDRSEVDRVVFTISGDSRPAERWAADIGDVIPVILAKYPAVRQIALQPVVGGPGEGECLHDGETIRASRNHPVIDQGIALADAAAANIVIVGASPTVGDCSHYSDRLGHLTPDGGRHVAAEMAVWASTGS